MGLMKITSVEMKEWRKEVTRGHVNPSHMRRLLAVYAATEKENTKLLALVAALDERKSAEEQLSKTFLVKKGCGRIIGLFNELAAVTKANKKVALARSALTES